MREEKGTLIPQDVSTFESKQSNPTSLPQQQITTRIILLLLFHHKMTVFIVVQP